MSMQAQHIFLTEEDYLASELLSEVKREYIDGEVYAMAGASINHVRIVTSLVAKLATHLLNTPCEPFFSDMKVKVGKNFFYPDVIVDCRNENGDAYYTQSPILIVEVLSKSTRRTDKAIKRLAYQALPSLQEYILIEQDAAEVEICRRNNHWQPEYYFLGDTAYFASIELSISVEEIYARVENQDMADYLKLKQQKAASQNQA